MKTIFVGDVHGCYDELVLLFEKLKVQKNDEVIFVGDIINKGPKSFEVLEFVYQNNYQCVLGNHEVKFFDWRKGKFKAKLEQEKLFQVLDKKLTQFPDIEKWLYNLPYFIEKENFIVVHAGFPPFPPNENLNNQPLKKQHHILLTTIRNYQKKPWHEFYNGNKIVFYGHWAKQGLHLTDKTVGLDSGCVYGNFLSAYVYDRNYDKQLVSNQSFHQKKIIQQKAKKNYCPVQ